MPENCSHKWIFTIKTVLFRVGNIGLPNSWKYESDLDLRSGGSMLSSIRFSCSLAAAEGPWEETTDEAEKNLLRISSFFLILVRDRPGHPGKQGVSRMSRIVFTSRHSAHPCRWRFNLQGCSWWCADVFVFSASWNKVQFSKWNPGFSVPPPENQSSINGKTGSPHFELGFSHLPQHLRGGKVLKSKTALFTTGGNTRSYTRYVLCI